MKNSSMLQRAAAIRAALEGGEDDETIADRLCTTIQAVRVIRKGLEQGQPAGLGTRSRTFGRQGVVNRPAVSAVRRLMESLPCPWRGRFVSMDGTNVSGWSRRYGEPRLVQVLAVCRYFSQKGVCFRCWFDASFRPCLRKWSPRDADALEIIMGEEPELFKFAPAGPDSFGNQIKADPYIIRDAESVPGGLILSNDLYRHEAQENPHLFGWTQQHPERRITGQIAANGDVLLGDGGLIRIPVRNDPMFYLH